MKNKTANSAFTESAIRQKVEGILNANIQPSASEKAYVKELSSRDLWVAFTCIKEEKQQEVEEIICQALQNEFANGLRSIFFISETSEGDTMCIRRKVAKTE